MSNDSLPLLPSSSFQAKLRIMESIFDNLSNTNLFKCRMVRKSWAREAGSVIGKRLDKNESTLNALKALKEIQKGSDFGINLKKLRILVPGRYNIKESPIQVYDTVISLDLKCSPFLVPHLLVHLFPNLQSVYLTQPLQDYYSSVEPGRGCPLKQDTVPKLLKLDVCLKDVRSINRWKSLVEKLMKIAVNLESFVADYVDAPTAAAFIDNICSSNLKSIKFGGFQISEKIFTSLCAHPNHFPLETIHLELINRDTVYDEQIKHLLTRYSPTLRELVLRFNEIFEMDFPLGVLMTNLHTLRISHFKGSLEWRNLPQLKKLILRYSYFEGIASSISLAPQYCRLQALTIFLAADKYDDFIRSFVVTADHLGRTLHTLHMFEAFFEALLPVIFTKLTQLSRLTLAEHSPGFRISKDQYLCGTESLMFTHPVEKLSGPPLNEHYNSMIASAKESCHARGPNITNLKDLQFLALDGVFSEAAFLHGIIQCEKLGELIIFSEACRMSRDSVVHLVLNADLKHLTRMELNGERINHLRFDAGVPTGLGGIFASNGLSEMFK